MPTTTTTSSLGVAMALPPGTSSQLESLRAQELQRRHQAKKQDDVGQQPSESQPSPPPTRRLAPQRKKKTPPSATAAKPLSTTTSVSSTNEKDSPALNLPIDISAVDPNDDDDHMMGVDFEDGSHNNGGMGQITTNVADWTLNATTNKITKEQPRMVEEGDERESQNIEQDDEYHGEIESIASSTKNHTTSPNNTNNEDEEEEDLFQIQTESQIPLNPPPPSMPLVLVDLESLCGCAPEDEEEKQILVRQLLEEILGSSQDNKEEEEDDRENTNTKNLLMGDGLNLEFDERVTEMFESNVAQHVDSSYAIAISCLQESSNKNENECGDNEKEQEGGERKKKVTPYAIIPYPEFLSDQTTNTTSRSTLRLWKLLHILPTTSTSNPNSSSNNNHPPMLHSLLTRLFTHLRNTSRSLLWKADMHFQISLLAKNEYLLQKQRLQQCEYNEWKNNVRSERLEKLYEVRETFVVRVEVAQKKLQVLVEEREGRVERELKRRGLDLLRNELAKSDLFMGGTHKDGLFGKKDGHGHDGGDVDGDGRGHDEDRYDDDGWGGTVYEDDIIGEETSITKDQFAATLQEEEEEQDEHDGEWDPITMNVNPVGMNIVLEGATTVKGTKDEHGTIVDMQEKPKKVSSASTNKLEPISHHDNLKRKSERLQQKQSLLNPPSSSSNNNSNTNSISNKQQQQRAYLQKEQASIREMLKSNAERIAEATLLKLQERLKNVDDLLESLQEEEWADEEDEEDEDEGDEGYSGRDNDESSGLGNQGGESRVDPLEPTLLDQILAMILGALPKKDVGTNQETNDEEHYKYIMEEHKAIVKEWIEVFGRLPPFPTSEPSESTSEQQLLDGREVDENARLPFGDSFHSSSPMSKHATAGHNGMQQHEGLFVNSSGGKKDLALIGNDDSNWDEVEDWDAMFP